MVSGLEVYCAPYDFAIQHGRDAPVQAAMLCGHHARKGRRGAPRVVEAHRHSGRGASNDGAQTSSAAHLRLSRGGRIAIVFKHIGGVVEL